MPHHTHKLKAYVADYRKRLIFCELCGKENDEPGLDNPCPKTFYHKEVDTRIERVHTKFVSGLPD